MGGPPALPGAGPVCLAGSSAGVCGLHLEIPQPSAIGAPDCPGRRSTGRIRYLCAGKDRGGLPHPGGLTMYGNQPYLCVPTRRDLIKQNPNIGIFIEHSPRRLPDEWPFTSRT